MHEDTSGSSDRDCVGSTLPESLDEIMADGVAAPADNSSYPSWVNYLLLLIISLLCVAGIEGVSKILCQRRAPIVQHNWAGLNQPDAELGYVARPNGRVEDNAYRNGAPFYKAVYTTDGYGCRTTPVSSPESRTKFMAFFGCSITFGLCVNDDQTFPFYMAAIKKDYMPYNFAYQGYGPQQTMLILQHPIEEHIQQKQGIGIYVFMPDQVRRAVGVMRVVANWAWNFPHYHLDGEVLSYQGSFSQAHPFYVACAKCLNKSWTLKALRVDWPLNRAEADYHLVARMVKTADENFHKKWPDAPFVVVFPPVAHMAATLEHLRPYLDRYGVSYVVCPDFYGDRLPMAKRTVDGSHLTAEANHYFAQWLADNLDMP